MTAATTDVRLRGGAAHGLAALAALVCALLLAPAHALSQAKADGPKEEAVDTVLTAAGALAIVRVDPGGDSRLELRLNGKRVADVDGTLYAGFRAHFREMESGEVVVMRGSDGGSGCPAQFRVIRVVDEASVSMTDEFGDCSDSPDITVRPLAGGEIQFRFPGYYRLMDRDQPGFRKPPPTTWVYKKGVLRELKPAPKKRG